MFKNFFSRRAQKRRELRSQLVDTLLHRLEREHSLVVNDELITQMGVGRRVFFQVVYGLVIQERMHMMSDSEGDVLLMTNEEFHRFMLRRSGLRETEIRLCDSTPVFAETISELAIAAREEDTVVIDAVAAELATLSDQQSLVPLLDEMDSTLVAATLGGTSMSSLIPEHMDETLEPLPLLSGPAASESRRDSRILRKPTRQLQLAGKSAEPDSDLGWFNLDVSPTLAAREKLPDTRQSLPDRPREPWSVNENSTADFDRE